MNPRPRRRRANRTTRIGWQRADVLAHRLGVALREYRNEIGMTQRVVGERAGIAQTEVSRLERGLGARTSLQTWSACGAAVGHPLVGYFERVSSTDQPRDIEHLRRQSLLISLAELGGWSAVPEAALPDDGPRPRSVDVLLARPSRREMAIVEVWDLLTDGGAAMRGLEAKVIAWRARLGGTWRVRGLFVVRATRRNRQLIRDLRPLFEARFPASSTAWLSCLTDSATPLPDADGLVWSDVAGTKLTPARSRRRAPRSDAGPTPAADGRPSGPGDGWT
jgi:transcriptional regulator with XRE-family HTH domain